MLISTWFMRWNVTFTYLQTPLAILGPPGCHFGFGRRCGVAGSERVPPSPLGWYFKQFNMGVGVGNNFCNRFCKFFFYKGLDMYLSGQNPKEEASSFLWVPTESFEKSEGRRSPKIIKNLNHQAWYWYLYESSDWYRHWNQYRYGVIGGTLCK